MVASEVFFFSRWEYRGTLLILLQTFYNLNVEGRVCKLDRTLKDVETYKYRRCEIYNSRCMYGIVLWKEKFEVLLPLVKRKIFFYEFSYLKGQNILYQLIFLIHKITLYQNIFISRFSFWKIKITKAKLCFTQITYQCSLVYAFSKNNVNMLSFSVIITFSFRITLSMIKVSVYKGTI